MPNCETLYRSVASDLELPQYEGEDKMDYSFRLIYSMVATWILSSFGDRPTGFESSDDRVSKSHVTGNALGILSSIKKIDPFLSVYFVNENDLPFVKRVEDAYLLLGFVKSGRFSFVPEAFRKRIAFSEKYSLVIDSYRKPRKMNAISPLSPKAEGDSPFDDVFLYKKTAKEAFEGLEKTLNYQRFTSQNKGKIKYYDPDSRRFKNYDPKAIAGTALAFLSFDDGAQYAVQKMVSGIPYIGYLPNIYCKWNNEDEHFGREGWRAILGYCSYIEKPLKAEIKPHYKGAHVLKLKYIWMPKSEEAVLLALAWPRLNSVDSEQWIVDDAMLPSVKALLKHLSIEWE